MEYLKLEVTLEDHKVQLPAPWRMCLLTLSSSPLHPGPGDCVLWLHQELFSRALHCTSTEERIFSQRSSFLTLM